MNQPTNRFAITGRLRILLSRNRGFAWLLFLRLAIPATGVVAQPVGSFAPAGSMTIPRAAHTATLLLDGRVLIAGGESFGTPTASAEIYDPRTSTFTPTGSMNSPRAGHTAILLPDGKVFISGGGRPDTAEIYDPATEAFSGLTTLPPNSCCPAALLNDGRVLFITYTGAGLEDPFTGAFSPAPRGTGGVRLAVPQPNGDILLLPTGNVEPFAIERYNPRMNAFTSSRWPFVALFFELDEDFGYTTASANLLGNGLVLLTMYSVGLPENRHALLFDSSTGYFTETNRQMLYARQGAHATSLPDGTVLVTGGYGEQCTAPPHGEVYNPSADAFADAGAMMAYRDLYAATVLRDGQVLITGGRGCRAVGYQFTPLASAELYRPNVLVAPPALLSASGDGAGVGAIQHADTYQPVSENHPAAPGEIVVIYCTGLTEGNVIPPQLSIGGRLAEISFFGNVPGYPGLNQINVRLPLDVTEGATVPIHLMYLGRPSNEVTISIQ